MVAILLLLIAFGVAVSKSSKLQTHLIHYYLEHLAEKLQTEISVEAVNVNFFTGVTIKKLFVKDLHNDTLAFIHELNIDIATFSISKKKIIIDNVNLNTAYINIIKHQQDSVLNFQFIVDYFSSSDTTSGDWVVKLNNVNFKNSKLCFNDNHIEPVFGIDYDHVELSDFNISLSKIEFIPQGINCDIKNLAFKEKSGFIVDKMSTDFNISPKGIVAQNLHITTPHSVVNGNVNFLTNEYSNLSEFITEVSINSYFESTKVSFKDLCFFATDLDCLNKSVDFEGEIRGRVDNLKARKVVFTLDDGTHFKGEVNITGIPEPDNIFMHIKVDELVTSKYKLEQLPLYPFDSKKFIELPDNLKHLGEIKFKGTYTGFFHDFVAYGNFYTDAGRLATDLTLKMNNGETHYRGSLKTSNFQLGKFLEVENQIGKISMDANIDGKGIELKDISARLEGTIKQLEVRGYNYQNINVKGLFSEKIFKGFMAVKDENLDFDFNGLVDFSGKIPKMNFLSKVNKAKLAKLNILDDKGLNTNYTMDLEVNLEGNHIDNLLGSLEIRDLKIMDKEDDIKVNSILLKSQASGRIKKISIESEIMNGYLEGEYNFKDLVGASTNNFVGYFPSFQDKNITEVKILNDFVFNITIIESDLITKLFLKNIYLSKNTAIKGFYHSDRQSLSIIGKFPQIDIAGVMVKNGFLESKSIENKIFIDVSADKIQQSDSLFIENFRTSSEVFNDSVLTSIKWLNEGTLARSEANLNFVSVFNTPNNLTSKLKNSFLYVSDTLWSINNNNYFEYIKSDSSAISKISLNLDAGNQSILIDGRISGKPTDQVDIAFKNFNLYNIQKIIPENILKISGTINGVASIKKEIEEIIFTSDLNFDKLNLNQTTIGNGNLQALWNPLDKKLTLDGQFYKGHLPSIIFYGDYFPLKKEGLDIKIKLQRADLQLIDNYTNEYLSNLRGIASADLELKGSLDNPLFNGVITLQKTSFLVKYLNASFSTPSCKIDIRPDMISYDNVVFFDEKGNRAMSNATLFHSAFKKLNLDFGFTAKNFLALNTTLKENELFYGKAFVSGLINIGLYKNKLNIEMDVTSEKETVMNIPLNTAEEISENDFIEFVTNDIKEKIEEKEVDLSNIEMNFVLHATPDAEVRLIFDEKVGDVIRARGEGDLTINISPQGEFKIYGDYIVKDGDYLFTLQNIINKKFNLEEGGKISWNGDPLEAQLNLTAIYRLRARLYELIASTEDSASAELYKKRTPINLKLNITNTMLSPDISFDIELPTADETTKNKVKSILYVSDQKENIQELNKQVFSLLVLNQFIPPDGGGTSTYSSVGSTTSSEMLSNQLSNWLSKISTDFDIGLNYRPGDEISNQEVELALSTQIFNDRVVLDGNLGVSDNKGLTSNQNANNLVGDFSIEYKITEDGKLRIKAFNQSNQFSFQQRSSNYTQGVGLFYRREFDRFTDLFRRSIYKANDK